MAATPAQWQAETMPTYRDAYQRDIRPAAQPTRARQKMLGMRQKSYNAG